MKQNITLLIIITLLILFVYFNHNYGMNRNNRIEGFIDVESFNNEKKENFNVGDTKYQLCMNYNTQCVASGNLECQDSGLAGCQKFKIKCEKTCENKKIDDNGKTVTDMDKCRETCQQVKTDCCQRLKRLT